MPSKSVDIEKMAHLMSSILNQEGLLDSDMLCGLHSVIDEIVLEAIENGIVNPDMIDPMLSDLYDAYEVYKIRPTQLKLEGFEKALRSVGKSIGAVPFKWTASALSKSLKTADQWLIDQPRYAEGIYSAVTFIAQKGGFNKNISKIAESLMLEVEELEAGKVTQDRLIQHSNQLAELLHAA
ncbi:MAG: hypothetical protein KDK44_01720 [Chlamydiia bacterium]|nr:hypothetical protein [Chlamydiia bacterium]MCP5509840.1 hypothetical protein [Chlamydiales bacterium]HPE84832.1 hypothetical protein [Chlamydiales bacterium]